MIDAGRLRHRVIIQKQATVQNPENGEEVVNWVEQVTVWAAIEPLSARDFIAAQAEQSKVSGRITIRQRNDIDTTMRIYHAAKDSVYHIEGILDDKDSGFEYITFPVSEGVRDS